MGAERKTRARVVVGVAIAAGIVVGSCSSEGASLRTRSIPLTTLDSAAVPVTTHQPPSSLAACGRETEEAETAVVVDSPAISIRPATARAGSDITLVWSGLNRFSEVLVENRVTISCWTGDSWRTAWFVGDTFGTDPFIHYPEDGLSPTDLGSFPREAELPVAGRAPAGMYRLTVKLAVCEPNCRIGSVSAYFSIAAETSDP